MNQALVQDVVAEVMKQLGERRSASSVPSSHYRPTTGVRAGEDAHIHASQLAGGYSH